MFVKASGIWRTINKWSLSAVPFTFGEEGGMLFISGKEVWLHKPGRPGKQIGENRLFYQKASCVCTHSEA